MLVATKDHCKYCFDVLDAKLNDKDISKLKFDSNKSAPLFVTWLKTDEKVKNISDLEELQKIPESSYNLRGCIGTFSSQNISKIIPEYTLISALQDSRFTPIKSSELPFLKVGISFLVNFEEKKDCFDWILGKNGIIIKFSVDSNSFNATYLPEIAIEQNWTKEEALESLIRKSGYNGIIDDKLYKSISLTTYESSKNTLTFAEWKKMK